MGESGCLVHESVHNATNATCNHQVCANFIFHVAFLTTVVGGQDVPTDPRRLYLLLGPPAKRLRRQPNFSQAAYRFASTDINAFCLPTAVLETAQLSSFSFRLPDMLFGTLCVLVLFLQRASGQTGGDPTGPREGGSPRLLEHQV